MALPRATSQMNVTPMIDVVLVLLVTLTRTLRCGNIITVIDAAKGAGVERVRHRHRRDAPRRRRPVEKEKGRPPRGARRP